VRCYLVFDDQSSTVAASGDKMDLNLKSSSWENRVVHKATPLTQILPFCWCRCSPAIFTRRGSVLEFKVDV
jgi:hypothetical protein